jgi:hypothetical protein
MPWKSSDAKRHTRKIGKGKTASRQWANVSNAVLDRTGDEGAAVRAANSVISKRAKKRAKKRGTSRRG